MEQSYLIFSGDRQIEIIEDSKLIHTEIFLDGIRFDFQEDKIADILKKLVNDFEERKINQFEIKCSHPTRVLEIIKGYYDALLLAAGGLVLEPAGKILLIHRLGKWDLPKGKLEPGESAEDGALREVEEETGIGNLKIISDLGSTYHTYIQAGKKKFKETFWYLMTSEGGETVPQREEAIVKAEWISTSELNQVFENTYPNIFLLLRRYLKMKN